MYIGGAIKLMIKFALCDDNSQILSKLVEMLNTIFIRNDYNAQVVFSTTHTDKLVDFVNHNTIDVLFMDIDLNSAETGIQIAKQIRKTNKSLYLIFVTAHFEYIVSAYECKTFDFIQKPFSYKRLEQTVKRIFEDINCNSPKFIKINSSNDFVNENLVNFIQKDGMKAIYSTKSGSFEAYCSFNKIEGNLPQNFIRCHKSFIVNVNNISHIDAKHNSIFFKGSLSPECFIGPKYKTKFMEVINNYGIF
jgi:DNA-binding LytR/AlgR family response regulator